MADFVAPEGADVSEDCELQIVVNIGIDLNASEEDNIVEEFNMLLRNKAVFDIDRYRGFIPNVIDNGKYIFRPGTDHIPIRDMEEMIESAMGAMRRHGVQVSKEDVFVESTEITTIAGPGLSEDG